MALWLTQASLQLPLVRAGMGGGGLMREAAALSLKAEVRGTYPMIG